MNLRTLLLFLAFGPAILRADLRLAFDVGQETDIPANPATHAEASHSSRRFPLTVVLGSDYMSSEGDSTTWLVDFAAKRIYAIFPASRTYRNFSLYSDIGNRVLEFHNRMAIGHALAAGGVKQGMSVLDPVLVEHDFALRGPKSAPMEPVATTPDLRYEHETKVLFSCHGVGSTLSEADAAGFTRFLRYRYPMHPDILDGQQQRRAVPQEFDIYRYEAGTDHFHFKFLRAEQVKRTFSPADAIRGLTEQPSAIADICAAADRLDGSAFGTKCDGVCQAAVREGNLNHPLDSMLLFMEFTLCTGRQMPPEFFQFKEAILKDEAARVLVASVSPKGRQATEQALEALRGLDAKAGKAAFVLKIFEADDLGILGRKSEAIRLFQEVLREDPFVVGAWKDLGDLYLGGFDTPTAWQCWDTGRRLLPTHNQFRQVNEFELKLVNGNPEFF